MRAALDCLSALAQPTRLEVFRMLVASGPDGVAAGDIAQRLGVPPATLSFHLRELEVAGLVVARRASRQIFYAAAYRRMSAMLVFLTEDCCAGRPEVCTELVDRLSASRRVQAASARPATRRRDTIVTRGGGKTSLRPKPTRSRRASERRGEP